LFYHKTLAFSHKKIYPEISVRAPASENIAGAASTASAFAHVPIIAGVPPAATSS
jgi:hypothetical protein